MSGKEYSIRTRDSKNSQRRGEYCYFPIYCSDRFSCNPALLPYSCIPQSPRCPVFPGMSAEMKGAKIKFKCTCLMDYPLYVCTYPVGANEVESEMSDFGVGITHLRKHRETVFI